MMTRRGALRWGRNAAVALVALGGAGYFGTRAVRATIAEHDLTRVGQGKPTIVQVHDPSCSMCTALQRETRRAMTHLGECDLVYLVANIKTTEGQAFASQYGVPHVTLLLFDGEGALVDRLHGVQDREVLRPIFDAHVDRV